MKVNKVLAEFDAYATLYTPKKYIKKTVFTDSFVWWCIFLCFGKPRGVGAETIPLRKLVVRFRH